MAGLIRDGSRVSFSLRAQGNVLKDPTRDALVVQRPLGIIGVFISNHRLRLGTPIGTCK